MLLPKSNHKIEYRFHLAKLMRTKHINSTNMVFVLPTQTFRPVMLPSTHKRMNTNQNNTTPNHHSIGRSDADTSCVAAIPNTIRKLTSNLCAPIDFMKQQAETLKITFASQLKLSVIYQCGGPTHEEKSERRNA